MALVHVLHLAVAALEDGDALKHGDDVEEEEEATSGAKGEFGRVVVARHGGEGSRSRAGHSRGRSLSRSGLRSGLLNVDLFFLLLGLPLSLSRSSQLLFSLSLSLSVCVAPGERGREWKSRLLPVHQARPRQRRQMAHQGTDRKYIGTNIISGYVKKESIE